MEYKKLYDEVHRKDTSYFVFYPVLLFDSFLMGNVLDIGSGQVVKNVAVTKNAIFSDISRNAMRRAGRKRQGNFVVLNAQNLPFKDESINSILCKDLLEHLPNDDKCLQEMERCLSKGGYICVHAPVRLKKDFTEIWHDLRAYQPSDMKQLFKSFSLVWHEFRDIKPNNICIAKITNAIGLVITKIFNNFALKKSKSFTLTSKKYPGITSRDYARYLYEKIIERPLLKIKPELGLNAMYIFRKREARD